MAPIPVREEAGVLSINGTPANEAEVRDLARALYAWLAKRTPAREEQRHPDDDPRELPPSRLRVSKGHDADTAHLHLTPGLERHGTTFAVSRDEARPLIEALHDRFQALPPGPSTRAALGPRRR